MKKIIMIAAVCLLALTGCSSNSESGYKDGTYTGSAKGMNGDVKVEVEVAEGKISKVTVTENQETPDISKPAIEQIPASIVEKNSTEVDTVANATVTSNAIISAVNNALESAK